MSYFINFMLLKLQILQNILRTLDKLNTFKYNYIVIKKDVKKSQVYKSGVSGRRGIKCQK